uniref:Uncharacterized protein n=1 Tax=Trypanosoma congolense (strain IL3000) TaxID=1068625 RepID=G0US86_TRYCI|nr:hypothetical protein, unlikely [Trypanosoma congolense IL3000]
MTILCLKVAARMWGAHGPLFSVLFTTSLCSLFVNSFLLSLIINHGEVNVERVLLACVSVVLYRLWDCFCCCFFFRFLRCSSRHGYGFLWVICFPCVFYLLFLREQ